MPALRRLAASTVLMTLLGAAPAMAAEVSVGPPEYQTDRIVTFTAAPGELNDVLFEKLTAYRYRITDETSTLAGGRGCGVDSTGHTAICTTTNTDYRAVIDLGDRGDSLSVRGSINTSILTGAGDDFVSGGPYRDDIRSSAGTDTLMGNGGADSLAAHGELDGGGGNDELTGWGTGVNVLRGGPGDDSLGGSEVPATELLYPGLGADDVGGGAGTSDTVFYDDHTARVEVSLGGAMTQGGEPITGRNDGSEGEGDLVGSTVENVVGGPGNDLLVGNADGNALNGGPGNDELRGGLGNDVLGQTPFTPGGDPGGDEYHGEYGDDRMVAGPGGGDLYYGGNDPDYHGWRSMDAGRDIASFRERSGGVTVNPYSNCNNVTCFGSASGPDASASFEGIEDFEGTAGPDTLEGKNGESILIGLGGDDVLKGLNGADVLVGDGAYQGDWPAPPLPGTPGTAGKDALHGGSGDDRLLPGLGADDVHGGTPDALDHVSPDTVEYAERRTAVNVSLDGARNDGALGEGDLVASDVTGAAGGSGRDTLTASLAGQANFLDGGLGKDLLRGGPGADTLSGGGAGTSASDAGDEIHGDAGLDTVTYRNRNLPLVVNLENNAADDGQAGEADWLVQSGDDRVENVVGGRADDQLTGNELANVLNGGPSLGRDLLLGRGGDDSLSGGYGVDTLKGEDGTDRLMARQDGSSDRLSCGAGLDDTAFFDVYLDTFPSGQDCEQRNP